MMRKVSILLFFSLLLLSGSFAQTFHGEDINIDYGSPKDYHIGGITVSGIKYLDGNVLIMLTGLSVGDKIKVPGDKISQAVKKLWEQGLFEKVNISISKIVDTEVFLDIYLEERPRLSRFSFTGIGKSDVDNIREKIKIVKGEYVTDNLLMKSQNIILKYYHDKGYLNAEVNIIQKKDTSATNDVALQFNIDRQGKVRIFGKIGRAHV